jgi:hypothetical protein
MPQKLLVEKQLLINDGKRYGQVVFLVGGGGCFHPDTMVKVRSSLNPKIHEKRIDSICLLTDQVCTWNIAKNEYEYLTSKSSYTLPSIGARFIEFKSKTCTETDISTICTAEHSFYFEGRGYVRAETVLGENADLVRWAKPCLTKYVPVSVYDLGTENGNYILQNGMIAHNSGKSFAIKHFLEGDKFKIYNVDYWKEAILKLQHLKNKYPELRNRDLRNAEDVAFIHQYVKSKNIESRVLNLFMLERQTGSGHLPNIIFDITGKNIEDISSMIPFLLTIGYSPENVHIVWVLADYNIAINQNKKRDRVVPEDIILKTHEGAAKTMFGVLRGNTPVGLNGSITVILNNPAHTVTWGNTKSFVIKDFKYITVKKSGHPINKESLFYSDLFSWIWQHIPRTRDTEEIIHEIENGIKFHG